MVIKMEWLIVLLVLICIILALLIFWLFAIAPRLKNRPDFEKLKKFDYAHRGLHNDQYPENSMPAFKNAVEHGYGMEFDLQLTKDKRVVIHHDNNLKRMCGVDKLISDLNYDELCDIKLGDTEYNCPLFSDVLEAVGGKTPLIIEYKGYGNVKELCDIAWEILKDYDGDYCVESFHPTIVEWFKNNHPEVIRGQLMGHYTGSQNSEFPGKLTALIARNLMTNILTRPDFEAYDCKWRHNVSLRLARSIFRMQEVSWTVRDLDTFNKLKQDGCICIFENFLP